MFCPVRQHLKWVSISVTFPLSSFAVCLRLRHNSCSVPDVQDVKMEMH